MDKPVAAEVLLDTSVLIDFFRKQNKAKSALFGLVGRYRLSISVMTAFEVKVGIRSERQQQDYDRLTMNMDVLPLDEACFEEAVTIYRDLKAENALIGLADLLIAASAVRYGLPVATLNRKHFEHVARLRLLAL